MSVIVENLATVKNHIKELSLKAGRVEDAVKLIAVSKTRSLQEVRQLVDVGQHCFGENTIQDALTKIPDLAEHDIDWHFIGHLQTKKAKFIPENFNWIHSVDSLKLAQKLSVAVANQQSNAGLNCLLQVNVTEEGSKSGLSQQAVLSFLDELLQQDYPGLNWRGLMTIGVQGDDNKTAKAFSGLRYLLENCQKTSGLKNFDQLSMGMSNDYAIAIAEGATLVRVGAAIFGDRVKE